MMLVVSSTTYFDFAPQPGVILKRRWFAHRFLLFVPHISWFIASVIHF